MLYFIPTPIGNIEDITFRAIKHFENTSLFFCEDTRNTKKLLKILEERYNLNYPKEAKFISFHKHNAEKRIEEFKEEFFSSKDIVFVSDAGMPCISDPGQELVSFAQKNSISYDVLTGASALTTAYASSGFIETSFLFIGFLAHKGKERSLKLQELMSQKENFVLYEAPHRLLKLIEEVSQIDKNREVFLAKEITKKYQTYYKEKAFNLKEMLSQSEIKGEWVAIIKGEKKEERVLSLHQITEMDLPPKIKAKLISQLTDKSIKECYQDLIS